MPNKIKFYKTDDKLKKWFTTKKVDKHTLLNHVDNHKFFLDKGKWLRERFRKGVNEVLSRAYKDHDVWTIKESLDVELTLKNYDELKKSDPHLYKDWVPTKVEINNGLKYNRNLTITE